MRFDFEIGEVSKDVALHMVQKYHYSNILPKLNKHFIGFWLNDRLVGVITLGWGTRPEHTIKRIFPSLSTKDYFEIGRMVMTDDMPRNSESQMISDLCWYIKQEMPEIKVLFTWADGMVGKVGYVYQACSFNYIGYSGGEMYMKDGKKIHVRTMKSLLVPEGVHDSRITVRPTLDQMNELGIYHYRGKQFAYLKFLCGKTEKKRLMKECLMNLNTPYPKEQDLEWKVRGRDGKWRICDKPPYITDIDANSIRHERII